jgi:hypothetical protein
MTMARFCVVERDSSVALVEHGISRAVLQDVVVLPLRILISRNVMMSVVSGMDHNNRTDESMESSVYSLFDMQRRIDCRFLP